MVSASVKEMWFPQGCMGYWVGRERKAPDRLNRLQRKWWLAGWDAAESGKVPCNMSPEDFGPNATKPKGRAQLPWTVPLDAIEWRDWYDSLWRKHYVAARAESEPILYWDDDARLSRGEMLKLIMETYERGYEHGRNSLPKGA